MKGVVLAGGTGSRLRPLTHIINKHLLPVGELPMIQYAIDKLSQAGIQDVLVITGKQSASLYVDYLGSGDLFGVNLTYKIQEKAGGIAQALALAEDFVGEGEKFVVILGDNLFLDPLQPMIETFYQQDEGAMVILKEVEDPRRYGVATLKHNQIERIIEKPEHPASPFAVTGIYLYDSSVFEIIKSQSPSARGEMEITDVNNVYAATGALAHMFLTGWWIDAGTHESLFQATLLVRKGYS
ncbi:Glucose-1-phosphate thymidylyltransferase [Paenibacillus allorhizoplanae]|uniref:Glucose-1-phosphate thymidylyltransferase n=1 Tax=Paenibacillus allorhizoplanae TaxID=2905648 RepID=A0ABM9CYD7_9BACL|nr:sugar phosphate nucleotidyltransferase [Paenibacillus allorhizoplanae]CAH1229953.1 Glucose-1-phosphate thymidylyltransferase [Paenibacillus allorhizoplanae]